MFNISSVHISFFRSFSGTHLFTLPTEPGLYLLTGNNLLNPRLGANATGKSTLLDAIFWCLYGRTTRGLKAADIVTWGHKKCSVEVTLQVGPLHLVITRTQSPNSLTVTTAGSDTRPVTQDELNKHLRLTPDQFLVAVLMPQFGESFFDRGPAEKLALFTEILGLDYWIEKSTEARDLTIDIEAERGGAEQALSTAKGAAAALEAALSDLEAKREGFETEQLLTIKRLEVDLRALGGERPKQEKSLEQAKACLKQAETKVKKFAAAVQTGKQQVEDLQERLAAYQQGLARHDQAMINLLASRKKLSGVGATCPVCLQKVDAKHLKAEIKSIDAEIIKRESEFEENKGSCTALQDRRAAARDQLVDIEKALISVTRNQFDFKSEVIQIGVQLMDLTAREQNLRDRIVEEKERINPFDASIALTGQKLTKARLDGSELTKKVDRLSNDLVTAEFWVGGFKRVRLFIIESTLRELELEVNNNLSSLGLADWRIEFDVERENKSGGITKGFTVMVLAPGHKEPVPLAAWSGGETQRLRMAGDLGLANLIMERAGLNNTIEMYDEPSRHLSQTGLNDLVEMLADRADDSGRRILMIDHNTLDFGAFKGVITIVKDASGSHIE